MAASDPEGGQKFWFNGLPFPGVNVSADEGGQKFWFNGLPIGTIYPTEPPPPPQTPVLASPLGVAWAEW